MKLHYQSEYLSTKTGRSDQLDKVMVFFYHLPTENLEMGVSGIEPVGY